MKIFIDFDDVLFNTKNFKKDLLNIFIKNGITREQFKESYWGKRYNLEKQIEIIRKIYSKDTSGLEKDIEKFLKDLKDYVFLDVHDFLKFLGKENAFVTSYGHKKFQEQKIKSAGVVEYFNKVIITHSTKSESIHGIIKERGLREETLYFLDDRIKYIEEVKSTIPNIKTILIKRPEGRYDDKSNKYCDFVAKNLKEVKDIIK